MAPINVVDAPGAAPTGIKAALLVYASVTAFERVTFDQPIV